MRELLALGGVVFLLALAAPVVLAHGDGAGDHDAAARALLGERVSRAGDLYSVKVAPGIVLNTHGPDPKPAPPSSYPIPILHGAGPVASGPYLDGTTPKRPVACTDSGYRLELLYAHLGSTPDELNEDRELITSMVERTNFFLNAAAVDSGGAGADFKFACGSDARPQARSFATSGVEFDDVVDSAVAAGYRSSNVDYVIFLDATVPDYCGIASLIDDDRARLDNFNNSGQGYAIVYRDCWESFAALHEIAHTEGAVQAAAPHSTGSGGHCNEGGDVMCYVDGGDRNQKMVAGCLGQGLFFDCGYDDYFDAVPEPGEYLATHWNIGSPLNRMIRFPASPPPPPPPPTDPPPVRLRPGSGFHGNAAAAGSARRFTVRVPRFARSVKVSLRDPNCAGAGCYLELNLAARPERGGRGCRSDRAGSRERCRVRWPRRGRWQITVGTEAGAGELALRVSVRR